MSGEIIIKCTDKMIMKFCRGEMLFSEMVNPQLQKPLPISEMEYWEYDLLYPGDYKITTDDILVGIRNGIEKISHVPEDDTDLYIQKVEEFFFDWFEPLYEKVGDMVALPAALGYPEIERMDDMWEVTLDGPIFFPRNLYQLAYKLMQEIDCDKDQWSYSEDDVPFLRRNMQYYIYRIDQFEWNNTHHTREWKFDTEEAKYYLRYYRDEKKLATLGTTKQELYKRYLEQFSAEGDLEAIEIKGYFCYGDGNPLYTMKQHG